MSPHDEDSVRIASRWIAFVWRASSDRARAVAPPSTRSRSKRHQSRCLSSFQVPTNIIAAAGLSPPCWAYAANLSDYVAPADTGQPQARAQ